MTLAGTQDRSTVTKYPAKWETTQDSTKPHFPFHEPRPHCLEEGVSWLHIPIGSASPAKGGVIRWPHQKASGSRSRGALVWMAGGSILLNRTVKLVSTGLTLLHSSSTETPSLWWINSLLWTPMTFQFTLIHSNTNKELLLYYNEMGQAQDTTELEAFYKVYELPFYLFVLECWVRKYSNLLATTY